MNTLARASLALATLSVMVVPATAQSLGRHLPFSLRVNMLYVEAKNQLVAGGWQYDTLPAYGYSSDSKKVIEECKGDVKMCNEYPEIGHCSAQGHCAMYFRDHYGNTLRITTYGPMRPERLHVIGWALNPEN
jgi:hypothetical protein